MTMPVERINLIDYQRENLTEEELEEMNVQAEKEVSKLVVLSFRTNPNGDGRTVSQYSKMFVFVDWDYKGPSVLPGEVWLCSIEKNNSVYLATPLKRITSNILLELDPILKKSIIDQLWKENKKSYEEQFDEKYRQNLTQELSEQYLEQEKKAIAAKDEEIEGLNRKISELKKELSDIRSEKRIESFELASDIIDISSVEENTRTEAVEDESIHNVRPAIPNVVQGVVRPKDDPLHAVSQSYRYKDVRRTNRNSISSSAFTEGKYSVHISPNKHVILVRPDDDGDVVCVNNSLCIYGLEFIISYIGEEEMEAEYSSKYNGMLISTRFKP